MVVRLAQKRLRGCWLDRASLWVGAFLVLGWGTLVCLGSGAEELEVGEFVMEALVVSSWSAGLLSALGAARPFVDRDAREGLLRMMAVRGVEPGSLTCAYVVATVWRIAVVVAFPALMLWVLALVLSASPSGLLGRALLGGVIVIYAMAFATVLGLVVRWVTAWVPERPRSALLALIAIPYLTGLVWPALPSLPELSSGFASRLASLVLGGP